MKECTNDYFEEDILEDDLTDALERENAAILEIAIFALKDVQKELLYQLAIKGYSCQLIAVFRAQTDRNIRKIRDTMLKKLRKSFMQALQNRLDNHISLTKAEQIFYDTYRSLITDKKNKKTKEITNTI